MINRKKIWRVAQPNKGIQRIFAKELDIPDIVAQILCNRGICTVEEARAFLQADLESIGDPYLLKDMDIAVKRIRKAIEDKEKILIYGDYDVDGITSTSVLVKVLSDLGGQVDFYIPHRMVEGYGLNTAALTEAKEAGYSLVVTVDCGISAVEEAAAAIELGLDLIITDHHEVPSQTPKTLAIINPKQPECPYPYKELAGVGVAFKLAHGLLMNYYKPEVAKVRACQVLDIVALGTVADIVPLREENRVIVKHGLDLINKGKRLGLRALIDVCGLTDKKITTGQVGFGLGPRLNAAGRMGDAKLGVQLLLSEDSTEAYEIAKTLDKENHLRQEVEAEITEAAIKYIEENIDLSTQKVLIIPGENWHSGVIGIVASRIVERYHLPTILLTFEDSGDGKGSARSISGFDMYKALETCSQYLTKFGGHHQAAGLSMNKSDLQAFVQAMNAYADEEITSEMLIPTVNLDGVIPFQIINENIVKELQRLEPFGMANPGPVLANHSVSVVECRCVGNEGAHLKLKLAGDNQKIDGIGFNLGAYHEVLAKDASIDVAFSLDINEWNGRRSVQLMVKDLKLQTLEDIESVKESPNSYNNQVTHSGSSSDAVESSDAVGSSDTAVSTAAKSEVKAFIDNLFARSEEFLEDDYYRNIGDKEEFYTKVVGVTFEGRQDYIKELLEGEELLLVREPDNQYDANAIAVVESNGNQIGFLNSRLAKHFAVVLDQGENYQALISSITGGQDKNLGVNIFIKKAEEVDDSEKLAILAQKRYELAQLSQDKLLDAIRDALLKGNPYRGKQWEAITSLLGGYNTLAIFGTGRGKSAVFQTVAAYKALAEHKITIIIYPLRALVNDQYEAMKTKLEVMGLRVYKGNGSLSTEERANLAQAMQTGEIDILLTTPEFIECHMNKFQHLQDKLGLFVVDESHHISLASKAHRPAYKRIDYLLKRLGNPLSIAVTATANDKVAEEIIQAVGARKVIIDPHVRDNLNLVDKRDIYNKNQYIKDIVAKGEKTIIYVNSRNKTIEIACFLRQVLPRYQDKIIFYNAGLNNEQRATVEKMFRENDVSVVVTTSAFGEGIDIPDVKNVVLYHLNFNFTEFNQQSGRAGRDGAQAQVHLLCGQRDSAINEFILNAQAPSRELLKHVYTLLLKLGGREKNVTLTNHEMCMELEKLGIKGVRENTISASLGIFEELNLIQRENFGRQRIINILPANKIELEKSLRYTEGLQEKEEFERFCEFIFSEQASELLNVINKPIYPVKLLEVENNMAMNQLNEEAI